MKGFIKSKTSDKYLLPIRLQMINLIESNISIIDFGCGTGDFLIKLSKKIKYGVGIDQSKSLIAFAKRKAKKQNIENIDFITKKVTPNYSQNLNFNYSSATLFFHVLPIQLSTAILKYMGDISNYILISGFCKPRTTKQKLLLWLDQRFSAHYKNYKAYQQNGYLEGFIHKTPFEIVNVIDTFDPTIKIYKLKKQET